MQWKIEKVEQNKGDRDGLCYFQFARLIGLHLRNQPNRLIKIQYVNNQPHELALQKDGKI